MALLQELLSDLYSEAVVGEGDGTIYILFRCYWEGHTL